MISNVQSHLPKSFPIWRRAGADAASRRSYQGGRLAAADARSRRTLQGQRPRLPTRMDEALKKAAGCSRPLIMDGHPRLGALTERREFDLIRR
jgi:hypothetical protein